MQDSPKKYSIIFDLGNVLIRWDPRNLYRKIFGADVDRMEWFLANVCTMEWNETHDAGRMFVDGIAALVPRFPAYEPHIRAFFHRWEEMLGGAIEENVDLLTDLKDVGFPVYALSNWSTETFPIAQQRFAFLRLFDGLVLSGAEKLIKPDPEIYRKLLQRYALRADDCVFIDDSLKNVEAAASLGLIAIHYTAGVNLRSRLSGLGIDA